MKEKELEKLLLMKSLIQLLILYKKRKRAHKNQNLKTSSLIKLKIKLSLISSPKSRQLNTLFTISERTTNVLISTSNISTKSSPGWFKKCNALSRTKRMNRRFNTFSLTTLFSCRIIL